MKTGASEAAGEGLRPRDAAEAGDILAWAAAEGRRLDVIGSGSRRGVGRPMQTDLTLDLSAITGITLYEPEELVLSARAGTPLAEIEAALAAQGQELAFEPMSHAALDGANGAARGTVGGALAANASGPRRLAKGAARDHFLGFAAISGRGERFKSGGRVVKNVTGYDLAKLMAGSWGTLAVMTDVTLKVLPAPETVETVLVLGLDDAEAASAMSAAMGSSAEVSGAAHLPQDVAARLSVRLVSGAGRSVTALRVEGFAPSVAARRDMLVALLRARGALAILEAEPSRDLWRALRDVAPLADAGADRALWRLSTAPMAAPRLVAGIARKVDAAAFYDWAGGLVWLSVPEGADAAEPAIRGALAEAGGHATLMRAAPSLRAALPVFQPQAPALAALAARIKDAFDPRHILNPGRLVAEA